MGVSDLTYNDRKMPLLDHLIELRTRMLYSVGALFVAFFICFFFAQQLLNFLAEPLADVLMGAGLEEERYRRLIYTDLTEVFFTQIKIAFFFGAFFTTPIFLTQLWKFVAPGLYANEKRAFAPFLVASPMLFFLGAGLLYYLILPFAFEFFVSFETAGGQGTLPIDLEPKVNEYLALIMKLIFAFGICFQLPVVMTLMARAGLATSDGMRAKRKYAIVAVFIVAAVFTPPDPISQISLAVPIIILYEISIHMARLAERQRARREAQAEAEALGREPSDDERPPE